MNVLVIGDEHTYGYGLAVGKLSFIGHFIRQMGRTGRPVSVDVYAHLTMSQTIATLAQLPLNRYDLIILQLDHTLIQVPASQLVSSTVVQMPVMHSGSMIARERSFKSRLKSIGTALRSLVWPNRERMAISVLLNQLRPYRHNVLLLTPLASQYTTSRWLQRRSRAVVLQEADKRLVSVFDTDSIIRPREEYFLPNDQVHLNAIGHELLGRSLYDFYESAPTIVTIQSIRRDY
ncbi:SGNH/GDSL hydrolase family protein [Spirosoma pulveris]